MRTELDGSTVTIRQTPSLVTTYTLAVEEGTDPKYGGDQWRWVCSCQRRGHWTGQSPSAAAFAWIRHLVKGHGLSSLDAKRLSDSFMEAIRV